MTSPLTPGIGQPVAPGISFDLIDDTTVQIVHFENGSHATLDNWVAFTRTTQSTQQDSEVVYLCLDIRKLDNPLDPYFIKKSREIMAEQGSRPILVAVIVPRSLGGEMLRMEARLFKVINHTQQRLDTFFTLEDALRWLRVNRDKHTGT